MSTIKTRDINIYYEVHGKGEPIVLIGGLGTELGSYSEMVRLLSNKHKVLTFDNRGEGRTDKPDIPYTIKMMAEDTAGLITTLGLEPAHVIGISMGGRIAMALALQRPELVRSLILTSTFARRTRKANLPLRYKLGKMREGRRRPGNSNQPYYAFRRQLRAARDFDCGDRLDEIRVPTLILHGRADRAVPYHLAEEMHAGMKGSQMVTFSGGHRFCFYESEQYTHTILEFLEGLE
jgi:3-oxoadipate enol-lactonase